MKSNRTVYSRYPDGTLWWFFSAFLQDPTERPGPCKCYVNFNAVLLLSRG